MNKPDSCNEHSQSNNPVVKGFDLLVRHSNNVFWGLCLLCTALLLADFFYHKHGHFDFEQIPGFYGIYGFLAYCAIVLSAKQLRKVLKREENYYDD